MESKCAILFRRGKYIEDKQQKKIKATIFENLGMLGFIKILGTINHSKTRNNLKNPSPNFWELKKDKRCETDRNYICCISQKEAWRRSCDVGSHTCDREFKPHAGHIFILYVFRFISAPSCRVPCPDGIELQSLGNVRFRNWRRELGNDYCNDQL